MLRSSNVVKFAPSGLGTPRMTRRRLPPLVSLRTFEVVARHLSIIKAADELCVTPAAVSHQIRTLEAHLGQALFRRSGRNIVLTEAGEACLPGIRDAFQQLSDAIAQIDTLAEGGVLTVSVAPSFAIKWLVPRLDRFQQKYPAIDVRVAASNQLSNFTSDNVDVAIRYGGGRYPDLYVERLLPEAVFPVCSPELYARHKFKTPADLHDVVLLHDDSPDDDQSCPTWQMWFSAAKVKDADWNRGPRFTQSSLVLEAAIHGKGVALAKATLAAADIEAGRLVRLFNDETPIDFAYYIVGPQRKMAQPKVAAFVEWLRSEVAAHNATQDNE
ncbi:transcriptional regulator GcvA [uncultured Ferrovibrio sp.]|jgi:LysR family glycine cleavage system transcriptional activator|uniref:transcriptional regulator GcvA n=1 Tax=uncultured Ferrovibrio sp. TaxID=1576913 RepID=UPI00262481A3|nr:transcriptional regulator GcvA [uncultured Ferrovibrio sp.]